MRSLPFEPEACLFDLDGTLIDSEPLFELSEEGFLASWGIEADEELRHELFGRSAAAFFETLSRRFPENPLNEVPLAERLEAKTRRFFETARGRLRCFPAAEALARGLAERGLALAIASSSNHEIIDFELEATGLAPLFPVRVSAVDVAHGKPEPDVFLEAARRLDADPRRCVVFEDSVFGLRAAKAAGAFTVSLPAPGADLARYESADLIVNGGPAAMDARVFLDFFASKRNRRVLRDDQ
ncbi:MAG TPA: HAD family phosphatase [Rectinemataceae bacterium]|nr:HAD family phosphatase [Rectinemataceae bacterium]